MAADHFFDLIVEEVQSVTPENAAAAHLKIDTLKWASAKLRPQAYSDKLQIAADISGEMRIERKTSPIEMTRRLAFAMAMAAANPSSQIEEEVVQGNLPGGTKP